jgi:hypothetical protein
MPLNLAQAVVENSLNPLFKTQLPWIVSRKMTKYKVIIAIKVIKSKLIKNIVGARLAHTKPAFIRKIHQSGNFNWAQ